MHRVKVVYQVFKFNLIQFLSKYGKIIELGNMSHEKS